MKKDITLINVRPPYEMKASTLVMAAQNTSKITQVLVHEKEVLIIDLCQSEDEKGNNETKMDITADSFDKIFKASHTVVIPDGMFLEQSRVFHTDKFRQCGLSALQKFYREGGTVLIQCLEGSSSVGPHINDAFGTSWKLSFFENGFAVPTATGKQLLGPFAPKQPMLTGHPYFIECHSREGIYARYVSSKEEFVKDFHAQDETFERLGIEKDESMDCFNVEKSWENYLAKNTDRYCISIHEGEGNEGAVVWYGDRGQSESMSFVFCKLLKLALMRSLGDKSQRSVDLPQQTTSTTKIDTTMLLSLIALLVAICLGYVYSK